MDRSYQANTVGTAPSLAAGSETGFPTSGNKASGQLATIPGAYWFHMMTEELRNALVAMGITPTASDLTQLAQAFNKLLPLTGGDVTGVIATNAYPSLKSSSATNEGSLSFFGGNSASSDAGAKIYLYGGSSSEAGSFLIQAGSTGGYAQLKGTSAGSLLWKNEPIITLTKSWTSGDKWYRKYSDGWIEQGGIISYSEVKSQTITFNTAFTKTPRVVFSAFSDGSAEFTGSSVSTSNFAWRSNATTTGKIHYYACGF